MKYMITRIHFQSPSGKRIPPRASQLAIKNTLTFVLEGQHFSKWIIIGFTNRAMGANACFIQDLITRLDHVLLH